MTGPLAPGLLPRRSSSGDNTAGGRTPRPLARFGLAIETRMRCTRCYAKFDPPPHIMAGRAYCCASCSVGSACEHQGVHRPANVRRYDSMFDRFRQVVRQSDPFETNRQEP